MEKIANLYSESCLLQIKYHIRHVANLVFLNFFWLFSRIDVWKHWKKCQNDFFDICITFYLSRDVLYCTFGQKVCRADTYYSLSKWILCKMITYNKWQHPLLFVYLAAVCLLCLLLSKFLLQKNISDMVPRFDKNQVENMLFSIAVHNINSKIKPWNHEIHKIIFSTFFLSPSWHHGPKNFSVSSKTLAVLHFTSHD